MAKCEFSKMTPEERRENGRKGGIASGEAKRKKKAMRERLEILLDMPIKSGKGADIESIKNFAALKGKNITVQDAMMIAQIQKALKGDTAAAAFIRDTAGEKPGDNMSISGSVETGADKLANILAQLQE
jgi:fumarylacetoacetate (FAA) hydrolase family protein